MKSQYCKRRAIYDIGFIDPYYIHEKTVRHKSKTIRERAASGRDPPTGFGSSCRAVTGMFFLSPLHFITCFPLQC